MRKKENNNTDNEINEKINFSELEHYQSLGEPKEIKSYSHLSKLNEDLFDEVQSLIVEKIIEVKRVTNGSKGERWKIFENSKMIFVLDGARLLKKEKEFLRSIKGSQFLLQQAKIGIKSVSAFRKLLKHCLS